MSAPTNPLLLDCDTEQELSKQPSSQEVSSLRGIFGYKPSSDTPVIRAARDTFDDLKRIGKKRKDGRPRDWSTTRRLFWASCWNLSVLGLMIYLCLVSRVFSDELSPCQPDEEFWFNGAIRVVMFNWLAPSAFFQITLGWGRFSFGTAKVIDVIWDLVSAHGKIAIALTEATGCWSRRPNSHGFCIMASVCPISPTLTRYGASVLQHSVADQNSTR
jgi:hypothetical protein